MTDPAQHFLSNYFSEKKPEHHILIWTTPGKHSAWFSDADAAQKYALKHTEKNVYFGLGLTDRAYAHYQRTSIQRTVAIASVWVDIDIAGPGHKNTTSVLDTRDDALRLLDALPLPPTMTVFSGGGLHAHWLLDSLMPSATNTEKEAATGLVQGWQEVIRRKSISLFNRTIDATHDLGRVLRVPATYNQKFEPVLVEVLHYAADRRYSVGDFAEYVSDIDAPTALFVPQDYVAQQSGNLLFNPDAQLPHDQWEALCDVEPKFRDSWNHSRRDLNDQTSSGYDLSMANYAVQAGWSDQDIINLLIVNHRKHGCTMKADAYYRRTIMTARNSVERMRAREKVEDFVIMGDAAVASSAPSKPRITSDAQDEDTEEAIDSSEMIKTVSTLLNIELTHIIKYTSDPPTYRLESAKGSIMLPTVEHLICQMKLRTAIAAATGHLIEAYKPAQWHTIAQTLLRICEVRDVGQDATDGGSVSSWVDVYLSKRKPLDDPQEAKDERRPYKAHGAVYLFMSDFVQWLYLQYGERHSAKSLGPKFTVYGASVERIAVKTPDGKPSTTTVWRLPVKP